MLYNLLLALHALSCFTLIIVVLLQSSKGGGLAGAFGGGGGQTMFGGQETATFLSKTTTYVAVLFMALSLLLALLSSRQNPTSAPRSVIREAAQHQSNVIPQGQSIDQLLSGAPDSAAVGTAADTTGSSGQ